MNQYKLCENYSSDILGIEVNVYDMKGIKVIHANSKNGKFVFQISIPIKLTDNKGTAHIVEHAIVSEIDLSKLRSTISAETNIDKIVFTIYSESEEDLLSSINLTLKEIYSPKFLNNEDIYRREGIDYYYDSTGEKLIINGVVYNEMKWIKSNPMELIKRLINVQLFKGSSYGYQCGGDSNEIAKSVYEDVISFYRDNYTTPLIYLYGNIEIDKVTKLINRFCINNYNDYDIKFNENFKYSDGEYSYLSESLEKKNIVSFSYNIGKFTAEKYMYLQYLKELIYTDIDKIFGDIDDMSFAVLINDTYRYGIITFFFIGNNESIKKADTCFDKLKNYISENICKSSVNEHIIDGLRRKMFNLFELSKPFEIELGNMILNRESYNICLEDYLELPKKEFNAEGFTEFIRSQIIDGKYSKIKVFPEQYGKEKDEAEIYLMNLLKDNSKDNSNNSKRKCVSTAKKENNFKSGIHDFIDVKTYEYKDIKVFNQIYENLDKEYLNLYLDISELSIREKQILNVFVYVVNSIYGGFYNNNPSLKDNIALKIINFDRKGKEIESKLLIILAAAEYDQKDTLELMEKYIQEIRDIASNKELLKKVLNSIFKETKEMDERSLYREIKILTNGKFSELGKIDFQLNSIYIYKFIESILQDTEGINFKDIVEKQLCLKPKSILSYHSIKENKSSIEKFILKQIRTDIINNNKKSDNSSNVCIKDAKSLGIIYDTNMFYIGYGFPYDYENEYEFNVMSLLTKYINNNYIFPNARERGAYFADMKTYYSEKTVVVYIMRFTNIDEIIDLMNNLKVFIEKEINMEEINYYKQQLIDYQESFKNVDYRYSDKFVMDYINEDQEKSNNIKEISELDIKHVKKKFLRQIENYFRVVISNENEINKYKEHLDKIEKFI